MFLKAVHSFIDIAHFTEMLSFSSPANATNLHFLVITYVELFLLAIVSLARTFSYFNMATN